VKLDELWELALILIWLSIVHFAYVSYHVLRTHAYENFSNLHFCWGAVLKNGLQRW
jgi:hypothetical protein